MKVFRSSIFTILVLISSVISLRAQDIIITGVTTTDVSCGSGSDGTITVTILGGNGLYKYLLVRGAEAVENSGFIAAQNFTFTGHDKYPSYIIIVSDQDDETDDGLTFATIDGPDPISITSFDATDITCDGLSDGTITVTATGEGGNFIFNLAGPVSRPPNETGFFSGLPQGDYTVTVSDKDGCPSTDVTPVLTITNPSLINITVDNVTHVDCFGDNTGSITITPSGGTPGGAGTGYTYDWTGPGGFSPTSEDISNLQSGDYFVTVYDGNMCSANTGPITVNQPPDITATLNNTTDVTCNGGNDGIARITAGGGAGGYTYSWDGQLNGLISTDEDPANLVADIYDLTIFDANGCSKTFLSFATINEPDPFAIAVDNTTDVGCAGGADGSASITPSGGTPAYTYFWSGATSGYFSSDKDPANMPADLYSLTITDASLCSQLFTNILTINEPAPITVVLNGFTEVSCFGGSDGSANITITGGTPPYNFSWTGDGTGHSSGMENPNDLVADTYDLTVTDDNGCLAVYNDLVTITEPADLSVMVDNITDVDCNGAATGAIEITPSGGTPVYSYTWSGPNGFSSNFEDISNLEAGTYSLTFTDARGCTKDYIDVATVDENSAIDAIFIVTDISCFYVHDGAIDATISGGTPNYTYHWDGPYGLTYATKDISGLIAGIYRLTVTDNLGCIQVLPDQAVTTPLPISATATHVDIDCFDAANGSIDLTASGGTPPYTFAWTGPGGFTAFTKDISSLEPGAYSVTVTDAILCFSVFTDIATIVEAAEIQVSSIKTDISCGGLTDGSIGITVTGGNLPYMFDWTGPGGFISTLKDISGLEAGSYGLTITDGNGCVVSFPNIETIIEPASISASYISHQDVLCNGGASGTIEINVTGGIAPLIFDWTNSLGTTVSTDEDPVGLAAETYSLSVTDANGCSASFPDLWTITEPLPLSVSLAVTDVAGCSGYSTGSVAVTGSGGTDPIFYSLNGGTYQASGTFIGLAAGFHTVSLKDNNDCTLDTSVSIAEPAPLIILSGVVTNITCAGAGDGIIKITASGGTSPLKYTLSPGAVSNSNGLFSGLMPGVYTVSVNDAEGCGPVNSSPLTIIDPPTLLIDSLIERNISCNGAGDGTISIYVSGGVVPYEYSIDNQGTWTTDSLFTGLSPNTYEVYIRDFNFCLVDGGSFVFIDPPLLSVSVATTDITTCSGDTTGVIVATGSGGTGNLEYSLDGLVFFASGTFGNLSAGSYTVYVRDEGGCSVTEPVTINEPAPVFATIIKTDATFGNLGSITISGTIGGTPPYEYTIDGPSGPFTTDTSYTMLDAATYHVIARDLNGCTYDEMIDILDVPPLDVAFNVTHVTCFGAGDGTIEFVPQDAEGPVEYSIDSGVSFEPVALFENLQGNITYYLVAMDSIGKVFTDSVTITEPSEIIMMRTITAAECNAYSKTGAIDISVTGGTGTYTYLWSDGSTEADRSNIVAGDYILEITDSDNCTRTDMIVVSSLVIVNAVAGEDATICQGESIQLDGLGGNIPTWSPTKFLSDPNIANPMVSQITETTTYVLTITEETSPYGCFNTDSVTISVYPLTGIDAGQDTFIISGNSVQLEATGGPFSTYRWEPSAALDNSTIPNPMATPLESIIYYVYGINDFGCEEMDSVFIEVIENLKVYNVFSPNGDGTNDEFEIDHADRFPNILVEVYSRWGDMLFSTVGYDDGSRWDGTARGKDAPVGTYYYIIIPYSGAKPITGNVTIIR